jgi:hypothetical protein
MINAITRGSGIATRLAMTLSTRIAAPSQPSCGTTKGVAFRSTKVKLGSKFCNAVKVLSTRKTVDPKEIFAA